MNILFITAHKYLPQMYGGLQTCTDELCKGFLAKGHKVSVLAGLMPGGWFGFVSRLKMQINMQLYRQKLCRDTNLGYPVWRSWFPWENIAHVAGQEKPDIIVVMAIEPVRMALAAKPTKIPLLMQLMDVEFKDHGGPFEALGNIACIANSHFTANTYHKAYGVNSVVIYPFIASEKYETETSRENITFINPVAEKGRDIAIEIARLCPEIPFSFVEGWPLSTEQRNALMQQLSKVANITLLPPQKDMRKVYAKCKILLAPSKWDEAYGRIATEAQFSGIPVVASRRGGLPEAVGPGGILLDPDGPIGPWVAAIKKLWEDKTFYDQQSAAATAYSHRPEMSYAYQLDMMEQAFMTACHKNER